MPHEGILPGSALDWLRHAESDLELARIGRKPNVMLEDLCFHAQQAAGKAFKGTLVSLGIAFPATHNLKTLLDLLPNDVGAPNEVRDSASLTEYAVMRRYPGALEPTTEGEYLEALRMAETVVSWANKIGL